MSSEPGADDSYTCASCGGTFAKGRSDAQADAEAATMFPAKHIATPDDRGTVCDPCWLGIMGRVQIEAPELLAPGAPPAPGACYRTATGTPVHISAACRCPRGQ